MVKSGGDHWRETSQSCCRHRVTAGVWGHCKSSNGVWGRAPGSQARFEPNIEVTRGEKRGERRTIANPKWVSRFIGKQMGGTFPMLSLALKSRGGTRPPCPPSIDADESLLHQLVAILSR